MALVWITGLFGSGKTTLAKALKKNMLGEGDNPILMDGDVLREVLDFTEKGYALQDRKQTCFLLCKIS